MIRQSAREIVNRTCLSVNELLTLRKSHRMVCLPHHHAQSENMTPWQKVQAKFGLNAAALARAIKRDRSKISRHLRHPEGLINGEDQKRLMEAAAELNIDLQPVDLVPEAVR